MTVSLLDQFAAFDPGTRHSLAELKSPLALVLATLLVAKERCGVDGMTTEHMVAALEATGVATSREVLRKALGAAGNRVTRKRGPEGTLYRLMLPGERQAAPLLGEGNLQVVRFDGSAPRTARKRVAELMASLSGLVRICDPYYGLRTLDVLESVPEKCLVRFLTARSSDSVTKLASALQDFKRERPRTAIRIVAIPSELHDRYVLAGDALILLGHGMKDVGSKESFVVWLPSALAADTIKSVTAGFDSKWASATPL